MELRDIKLVVIEADPTAQHYASADKDKDAFTVWGEYERIALWGDDEYAEKGWKFEIDHFTRTEFSPIPEKIEQVLLDRDISFTYRVTYQASTGYIRHIFECEG